MTSVDLLILCLTGVVIAGITAAAFASRSAPVNRQTRPAAGTEVVAHFRSGKVITGFVQDVDQHSGRLGDPRLVSGREKVPLGGTVRFLDADVEFWQEL